MQENLYSGYVSDNEQKNYLDIKVLSSIIVGLNYTDNVLIYKGIEYLTAEPVNEDNFEKMRKTCKSYLLEKYNYLSDLNSVLNDKSTPEFEDSFFNLIENLLLKNQEIEDILELDLYKEYEQKI